MPGSTSSNGCVIFTGDHADQWVAAFGPDAVVYENDFVYVPVASDAMAGWTTTLVEAGAGESTVTALDASGGALLLTTDAADNDGINLQMKNESFLPSATKSLYFGCKITLSEATQSDIFIGLSVLNTTILGSLPVRIGFRSVDASASIGFESEGSTELTIEGVGTLVDATAITLEVLWDAAAGEVRYYVDGVLKGSNALGTALPNAEMAFAVHFLTGAASVETCAIDWVRVIQTGR